MIEEQVKYEAVKLVRYHGLNFLAIRWEWEGKAYRGGPLSGVNLYLSPIEL